MTEVAGPSQSAGPSSSSAERGDGEDSTARPNGPGHQPPVEPVTTRSAFQSPLGDRGVRRYPITRGAFMACAGFGFGSITIYVARVLGA